MDVKKYIMKVKRSHRDISIDCSSVSHLQRDAIMDSIEKLYLAPDRQRQLMSIRNWCKRYIMWHSTNMRHPFTSSPLSLSVPHNSTRYAADNYALCSHEVSFKSIIIAKFILVILNGPLIYIWAVLLHPIKGYFLPSRWIFNWEKGKGYDNRAAKGDNFRPQVWCPVEHPKCYNFQISTKKAGVSSFGSLPAVHAP